MGDYVDEVNESSFCASVENPSVENYELAGCREERDTHYGGKFKVKFAVKLLTEV